MQEKLNQLKAILAEVYDLSSAAALLGWDQQTYMPSAGAVGRGYQIGTLQKIAHNKFTSDQVGKLLEDLATYQKQLDPDSDDACLIRVTDREYKKQTRVTSEWVENFARETTIAHQVWEKARSENDFASFKPNLERIFELRREYSSFFIPYEHVYDPILDDFEPGLKTSDVQEIFNALRPQQVELIKAISEKPQVDDSFLKGAFDQSKQWDFGVSVITDFGYEWNRGRQDRAAHPFTQTTGVDDVRITTRIYPDELTAGMFSSMHESGHALYELGVDKALARTPLATGASLAMHESQSRMYENLVGRSMPFWEFYYPRLQDTFPSQLGNVSLEDFYRGINKVEPTLIRVEADEATYNMHVMLRLELEIALMEGNLDVKDLPDAWNAKMVEFLGITPPNDADGVLQDVHWSSGLIGYFSTYALGNLISLQLWELIQQDIPNLSDQIRKGQFGELLDWLRRKVHRHGAKYEPQELIKRITGSKIDPEPYMRYLNGKFSQIYNL
ncbi:MAG: carboxypeptidase M32 [Anaerolineales bacterium]|jgi:carboxypeptidase Taq